jgi:hypothetical protein
MYEGIKDVSDDYTEKDFSHSQPVEGSGNIKEDDTDIAIDEFPSFNWTSPKTILRLSELVCLLIAWATLAGMTGISNLDSCVNTLLVSTFAFIYVISVLVVDKFNLYTLKPTFLHQLEFAFDFMFFVLLFCTAIQMGYYCNQPVDGNYYT